MLVSGWRGSGRPTAIPIDIDGNRGLVLIGSSIHGGLPQNSRRFGLIEVHPLVPSGQFQMATNQPWLRQISAAGDISPWTTPPGA